jgi:hypothetical protein
VGENPYQDQTTANTDRHWLDDQKPVDVNLDGMAEFAKNMVTIKENLSSHQRQFIELLGSLPTAGWKGGALPEGAYARKMMMDNFLDFRQYLTQLGTALNNIGMAAQTIADAFSGEDEWNAATLDAVNWAFGDTDARRPPGLSQFVTGKTYYDAYFEALAQGSESTNTAGVQWTQQTPVSFSYGPYTETLQRATAPDGRVQEIRTVSGPNGTTITTRLLSPDGHVLSETSQEKYTYTNGNSVVTQTTNFDADGNRTGSTTKRTDPTTGDETTTQYDADGRETTSHSTMTGTEGTQTTTTDVTTYDEHGRATTTETQHLETGENTADADGEDPAREALAQLQEG